MNSHRSLQTTGVKSLKLPARSPNWNAYAERFVRTIKESCLDRMTFCGEASLRHAIREFVTHYHLEQIIKDSEMASSIPLSQSAHRTLCVVESVSAEC